MAPNPILRKISSAGFVKKMTMRNSIILLIRLGQRRKIRVEGFKRKRQPSNAESSLVVRNYTDRKTLKKMIVFLLLFLMILTLGVDYLRGKLTKTKSTFGREEKWKERKFQMEKWREKGNMVFWQRGENGKERKMEGKKMIWAHQFSFSPKWKEN